MNEPHSTQALPTAFVSPLTVITTKFIDGKKGFFFIHPIIPDSSHLFSEAEFLVLHFV